MLIVTPANLTNAFTRSNLTVSLTPSVLFVNEKPPNVSTIRLTDFAFPSPMNSLLSPSKRDAENVPLPNDKPKNPCSFTCINPPDVGIPPLCDIALPDFSWTELTISVGVNEISESANNTAFASSRFGNNYNTSYTILLITFSWLSTIAVNCNGATWPVCDWKFPVVVIPPEPRNTSLEASE